MTPTAQKTTEVKLEKKRKLKDLDTLQESPMSMQNHFESRTEIYSLLTGRYLRRLQAAESSSSFVLLSPFEDEDDMDIVEKFRRVEGKGVERKQVLVNGSAKAGLVRGSVSELGVIESMNCGDEAREEVEVEEPGDIEAVANVEAEPKSFVLRNSSRLFKLGVELEGGI
ncbi:hypothetical protein GYMLUDRAFT_246102 [Collybiopsis luxurians FD-317 M1]|uniref:Uncharacterized protein n=1 Tax=Collybiopsis luxurians FD-317 M1 TaxID=944289 RepID=A0A0D0BSQ3_9AGAR|nr:hypothetical protein GYMLUDRAFT_246102 [Collybiopsis luxurians FD-317 M1]